MSEKEKRIIQTMAEALPHMSEMDKGYFLGYAEAMATMKKDEQQDPEKTPDPEKEVKE